MSILRPLFALCLAATLVITGCDAGGNEPEPITSLEISAPLGERAGFVFPQGQSTQLDVIAMTASGATVTDPAVTWSSDNPSAVTVSERGIVTGVGPGTATVTVTVDGQTDQVTFQVFNLTGRWIAENALLDGSGFPSGTLLLDIQQDGDALTGSFSHSTWMTLGPGSGVGPVAGKLVWNRMLGTIEAAMGCTWTLNGTFRVAIEDGLVTLVGDEDPWNVTSSCGVGGSGQFEITMPILARP